VTTALLMVAGLVAVVAAFALVAPWQHRHRDDDWQARGAWRYDECSCGARRVRRLYSNFMSPVEGDWPRPVDRHGMPVHDTGWQRPAGDHDWRPV
jgi:hypothetical protein